ncbi:hypothetical protein [Qipengyuania atrilutea]|uniref:Lipoprotein n=1 Tax=Qipengyuania atrilutea TaxID=2744473 RepID=A0A850H6S5_9SPHN|nr:hypothetical protein [Actirhodobacter atriluteus]NVD45548.1 hypothetical protein [Actirhodobacter atriluteus]
MSLRTNLLVAAASGLVLASCTSESEAIGEPERAETRMPVEPDGGIGDGAPPIAASTASASFAKTMPVRLRGDWHKDDLGRVPEAEDCDPRLRGTIDWDRLVTVDEGGYSYFETGGRITDVHGRTDTMIDAAFDTTYADTPTSTRRNLTLQSDGTMTVREEDGNGQPTIKKYIRCPEIR